MNLTLRRPEADPSEAVEAGGLGHFEVRRPTRRWVGDVRSLVVQAVIVLGLLQFYSTGRGLAKGNVAGAIRHANELWSWERSWHLPDELTFEHWLLAHPVIARGADLYYANVHFPLTFLTLGYLFLCRRELYRWTRDVLLTMTAAGLLVIFLVPMAPPRMMTSLGFTDVAAVFGQSIYTGQTAPNQYASMPSLHVGWALLIGIALARAGRTRWRWLWLLHPVATALVVVGTANHYWSDVVVGVALCGLGFAAVHMQRRWSSTLRPWPGRPRG